MVFVINPLTLHIILLLFCYMYIMHICDPFIKTFVLSAAKCPRQGGLVLVRQDHGFGLSMRFFDDKQ